MKTLSPEKQKTKIRAPENQRGERLKTENGKRKTENGKTTKSPQDTRHKTQRKSFALGQRIIDIDDAPSVIEVTRCTQRFRHLAPALETHQQLGNNPPAHGVTVEYRFAALPAEKPLHPFLRMLVDREQSLAAGDGEPILFPGIHGMVGNLEKTAAVFAVTKAPHSGRPLALKRNRPAVTGKPVNPWHY
ncbi:hypothetical protein [Microbulbifer aestuariivivens]|uniref:hypothetical protein n=1 Tax=Microbulbifer aestuariivivens TaxID=1908308 RepID=UPI0031F0FE71